MLHKISYKIKNNLYIYKNDIAKKGLYWSVIHRLYKIPHMRGVLSPLVNILKPNSIIIGEQKLYIDKWDTTISQELIMSGKWEIFETELFIKNIKPGDTVVDIGAHIGYYTILAAKLVGENGNVYAFEPDPKNFKMLKKNIHANGHKNVILVNKAVSNKIGKSKLFLNNDNTGDHRIFDSSHVRKSVAISTTTLDNFFKDKNIKINLIKMDIQGAEGLALKGAQKVISSNRNIIIITEFWPSVMSLSGGSAQEFVNLLQNNSFKFKDIDEVKRTLKTKTGNQLLTTYSEKKDLSTNLICIREIK